VEAFGTWKPLSLTYLMTNLQSYGGVHSFASFHLFCFVFFLVSLSHAEHNLGVEKSNPNKALLYNTKVQGHGGPPFSQPLFFSFNFLLCAWVVLCLYGHKTRWEGGQVHIWTSPLMVLSGILSLSSTSKARELLGLGTSRSLSCIMPDDRWTLKWLGRPSSCNFSQQQLVC
jgi:hypothetical protein